MRFFQETLAAALGTEIVVLAIMHSLQCLPPRNKSFTDRVLDQSLAPDFLPARFSFRWRNEQVAESSDYFIAQISQQD